MEIDADSFGLTTFGESLAPCGGVSGVSLVPDFIASQNPTLDRLLDHRDQIRDVAGIDTVA